MAKLTKSQLNRIQKIEHQFFEYGYNALNDQFTIRDEDNAYCVLSLRVWIKRFITGIIKEDISIILGKSKKDVVFSDLWSLLMEVRPATKEDTDQNAPSKIVRLDGKEWVEVERDTIPTYFKNINLDIA